jgi:hypothetical protein
LVLVFKAALNSALGYWGTKTLKPLVSSSIELSY